MNNLQYLSKILIESSTDQRGLLYQKKEMDISRLSNSKLLTLFIPILAHPDGMNIILSTLETYQPIEQDSKHGLSKIHSLKTVLMQNLLVGENRFTCLLNEAEVADT